MLDTVLPIDWKRTDRGFVGDPKEKLPANFLLLSPDFQDDNQIADAFLSGSLMRMSLPWLWTNARTVVLAAPLWFDWKSKKFLITADDLERTEKLITRSSSERCLPVAPRRVGCGGQLNAAPVTAKFMESTGLNPSRLLQDPNGKIWMDPSESSPRVGLPNALAFHNDEFPDSFSLTVEPTTACNFRCGFCYGRHLKQGVLRRNEFEALVQNSPELRAVEFVGEGEPLMNKDTPYMIAKCKELGMWVHVTSNGSRMTEARAEMLIDLGVDSFAVSTEATDPDNFRIMRPGGELSELVDAIKILRSAIERRGSGPVLKLWVSLLRSNLHRIDDFFRFSDDHGFDLVEFQTLNMLPAYQRFYPRTLENEHSDLAAICDAMKQPHMSTRARDALTSIINEYSGTTCHRFDHSLAPTFEGKMSPCVLLKVPDYPSLGDLTKTPLKEIWDATRFRRFRFALAHGVILQSCYGCNNVAAAS